MAPPFHTSFFFVLHAECKDKPKESCVVVSREKSRSEIRKWVFCFVLFCLFLALSVLFRAWRLFLSVLLSLGTCVCVWNVCSIMYHRMVKASLLKDLKHWSPPSLGLCGTIEKDQDKKSQARVPTSITYLTSGSSEFLSTARAA